MHRVLLSMLEAVEGRLWLLDATHRVLLIMLEAVGGEFCVLEVLEVSSVCSRCWR